MVAGIEITIVFHGHSRSARRTKYAKALVQPQPAFERYIENLDKIPAHILSHPFVKNCAQEFAILTRLDRPCGYSRLLRVRGTDQDQPVLTRLESDPFNNGNELQVPAADFFEKAVDEQRVTTVLIMNGG